MSKTAIVELRQKRAQLIADARALNDKILNEKRDFTSEEQNSWDLMMTEADGLKVKIDREERLVTVEGEMGEPVANGDFSNRSTRQRVGEQRGTRPARPIAAFPILHIRGERASFGRETNRNALTRQRVEIHAQRFHREQRKLTR